MLLVKPGGGQEWLLSLRGMPYREASEALCELPGIGPKVCWAMTVYRADLAQQLMHNITLLVSMHNITLLVSTKFFWG